MSTGFVPTAIMGWAMICTAAHATLRDGDRLVFAGSGLTEQHGYAAMTEAALLLQFPELELTFRNIGRTGDTAAGRARGGPNRLAEEILTFRPTHAVIAYGFNEARAAADADSFRQELVSLIERLTSEHIKIMLIAPLWDGQWEPEKVAAYERDLARCRLGLPSRSPHR
jgi:lysophospholipase L1-like esterase